MRRRTAWLATILTTWILVSGCSLLPNNNSRNAPAQLSGPTPTPIPTPIVPTKPVYTVQNGEVINTVQFAGRVAPAVEEELFFRTAGRVRIVYVKRDDVVTEGQVLADLEIDDLERDLTSTLLELERVEHELDEAEQQLNDQIFRAQLNLGKAEAALLEGQRDYAFDLASVRIDLRVKQLQLAKAQGEDPEPLQRIAKANLEESEIALRQAQDAYDKIAYSDSVGASSQAANLQRATLDHEKAKAAYEIATQEFGSRDIDMELMQQEVARAQLNVEKLEAGGIGSELEQNVALAQLEFDNLQDGVDPSYVNNVERAKLNVQKLEAAIADAQIVSPFDGQVLSISLTEGRDITTYQPVAIVANPEELEISADPTDSQLSELTEGLAVTAWLNSQPGELFDGTIRRLPYPYGGGGRSQGVEEEDTSTRIALEGTPQELGLERGDLVRIEVVLEQKPNVLWLPPQAIRTFEGRRFVVVQDGESQRRVDITVGIQSEDRVEIEEGLNEGDVVVGP
jgi:RND family efflux transporter MFP subunit